MASSLSRPPYASNTPPYLDLGGPAPPFRAQRFLLVWSALIVGAAAVVLAIMFIRIFFG